MSRLLDPPGARRLGGRRSALGLSAVLVVAGVLHLVSPRSYEPLIPQALGSPRAWVIGSGLAEILCGAAVAVPRTRRWGGWLTAALFVAVLPGNVTMAVSAVVDGAPALRQAVTLARLPLQVPLVLWALAVASRAVRGRTPGTDQVGPAET
ncbi:MAG: hypothetical protein JWP95_819 [Actinotalea sp.]|nr:hypothetical protein [Actinotalea sp.]